MQPSRPVLITGFMGAGKTFAAKALAERLGCTMLDLDEHIVQRHERTIRQIIEEDGETSFRKAETDALHEALKQGAWPVVALGGGAWTISRNRTLIHKHNGLTVWLDAPFELCWQRIVQTAGTRPLACNREQSEKLYQERQALYKLALLHVRISATTSADDIAASILNALPQSAA